LAARPVCRLASCRAESYRHGRRRAGTGQGAYDEEVGIFSDDGVFDAKAVAALKQSFIEMGLLKEIPDDKVMFTTRFVPVKAAGM
jgi:hypothetical protein